MWGPNPVSDQMNLELAGNETGEIRILVWDQLGQKMESFQVRKNLTVLEQTLELGKLLAGLYLLEVRLGKEVLTRKFVKH